ncbi:homoserine kinase [Corynebacterium variabile]|nr:homoserine kinase [Corynebacterium variabile]MDN6240097.1 homoserine kinase [Corynebacterium variabile]MDN6536159.1 homoserine kinase [Corynebacterium variabile]MDN6661681.1 homoserine kinase [Corynebacterium variabile]MDN6677342.1 homoserine kinase [Corynebacterium variabile]MDN6813455.1 homoserine kinase [Corynebacterium variabile]
MMSDVAVGRAVKVTVPASSANLGPGFDTLGLAVDFTDVVEVEATDSGLEVIVHGEGEGEVPLDERHLVVRAVRAGLREAGATVRGLKITCHNVIPHSRGLGSSAAAAVAGVVAASGLAGDPTPERPTGALDDDTLIQLAASFEGHPDNAAASVLGGGVISWTNIPVDGRSAPEYRAVGVPVAESVLATALIPDFHASTEAVRRVLPSDVSHVDARFNVSRAALLPVALSRHPELLWEATRDRLHQPYRAEVLPVSSEWVNRLRNLGYPAFLSGAGPTVMVLSTEPVDPALLDEARSRGLRVLETRAGGRVTVEVSN